MGITRIKNAVRRRPPSSRSLLPRAGEGGTLAVRLHCDERGTISIVTVFAVLLLVMLLGMVMNVGRDVDDKIRMQNSADAAAYSGGVVIARGMNTLTFSNHLLSDVFALTALMREARDRNAERYVPEILAAWDNVAPKFAGSGFDKFEALSDAIPRKVPLEQDLVTTFSDWGAAASELLLPTLETILAERLIPQFEQAVVQAYPEIAQEAAMQCAERDGPAEHGRGPMLGALWRSSGVLVGGSDEGVARSLWAVDPVNDMLPNQAEYLDRARQQRMRLAERYLGISPGQWYYAGGWRAHSWNDELLWMFDHEAKMGRFGSLWRGFTCGYLHELLEDEYPAANLPFLIGTERDEIANANEHLDDHFTFLAVVYREDRPKMLPGLFRNPADCDTVAYASVRVFIPQRRLVWHHWSPTHIPPMRGLGGMPGNPVGMPDDDSSSPVDEEEVEGHWFVGRESSTTEAWNLLNQRWSAKLVPTTQPLLADILQTVPPLPEFAGRSIRLPNLGGVTSDEIGRISTH